MMKYCFALALCIFLWSVECIAYRAFRNKLFSGLEKIKRQDEDFKPPDQPCFHIQQLEALKAQFSEFIDKNDDGKATYPEIKQYLKKYNPSVTNEQIEEFLARRDVDEDGEVDFIPDYISEVISPQYSVSKAREWFELEDTDRDGFVSKDELVKIATNIGMTSEDAEQTATNYYMSADVNGDKKLDWEGISRKIERKTTSTMQKFSVQFFG